MATYWLPSSTGYYDTDNSYVKYRIRIVEGTYDSYSRQIPITVTAYFYRTNSGYTTDYTHTLYYKINGTEYSFSNDYGSYKITSSGIYMNSKTVNIPVNSDGTVGATIYCKYTGTNSGSMKTSYNGGYISLTTQVKSSYTVTYNGNGGLYNGSNTWSNTATYNQSYYVYNNDNFFVRDGYKFIGWIDQNGTDWGIGDYDWTWTYNYDVTLYAQWELNSLSQTIMARYQKPDGTYTGYTQVYFSEYNQGQTCSWSFVETDEYHSASISFTVGSTSVTKYVDIKRKKYTVSYHANGGSVAPSTQSFYYGSNFRLTDQRPTRSGYKFLGWAYTANTSEYLYQQGNKYPSTDTSCPTLYAVWSKRKMSDTYLYDTGKCVFTEFVESDSFELHETGAVCANLFSEKTLTESQFEIGLEFIASELSEIHFEEHTLTDEKGNFLTDENGYRLIISEEV